MRDDDLHFIDKLLKKKAKLSEIYLVIKYFCKFTP